MKARFLDVLRRENGRVYDACSLVGPECTNANVYEWYHGDACFAAEFDEIWENRVRNYSPSHGLSGTKGYRAWRAMIDRCYNPKSVPAPNYMARGIDVATEWFDIEVFVSWFTDRGFGEKDTLERVDVNKGYCPSNCKQATYKEQANNKTNNTPLTLDGVCLPLIEWAQRVGVKESTLRMRLDSGWSEKEALTIGTNGNGGKRCRLITRMRDRGYLIEREASVALGLSAGALAARRNRGIPTLPHIKEGGYYFYLLADIQKETESQRTFSPKKKKIEMEKKGFVTEVDAAKLMGLPYSTLRSHRLCGQAPPHVLVGNRTFYQRNILEWLSGNG